MPCGRQNITAILGFENGTPGASPAGWTGNTGDAFIDDQVVHGGKNSVRMQRTAGSAIRRIGYERWLRNVAVGLGNAPPAAGARAALQARGDHPSALVREHVAWALERQSEEGESP